MQNILFLTLSNVSNIDESGIYQDLLREFARKGHKVFVVSPTERRNQEKTHLIEKGNANILRVKTGNIQKTNLIEKGIATILLESQYISAIKKYLSDVKIDLILYSTPPITLAGAVQYIKKRDGAKAYLMLKDIFPQNAVDLGLMSKSGIKGIIYKYFRNKEEELYALSDRIGCMSQANVDYIIEHNKDVPAEKVEVCPNCIDIQDISLTDAQKAEMREKYDIPQDKKVFVYGGNLGKPQGIPFLIECLNTQKENDNAFFLIIGDGTEYHRIEEYVKEVQPKNVKLLKAIAKDDFDRLVAACDVGMIFLDHRFTIPNFPSRLLSYMQAGVPVLACTDPNTDIGKVIVDGGFGWWCESKNVDDFSDKLSEALNADVETMIEKEKAYLEEHFNAKKVSCKITNMCNQ